MMRSTALIVIALAAGAAYADEPKQPPAAAEPKPGTKRDGKPDAKPESKPAAKSEAKPAAKPEAKPDAKPETKPAAKPEAKPDAKLETKPDAKPKDASGASAEVKVGTGVEKHEITGEATSFPAGTTVVVWSRVVNGEGSIKHVWKRDGKDAWTAILPVGSRQWATHSRKAIAAAGSWTVDVQTEAGASLGSVSFTVQ